MKKEKSRFSISYMFSWFLESKTQTKRIPQQAQVSQKKIYFPRLHPFQLSVTLSPRIDQSLRALWS